MGKTSKNQSEHAQDAARVRRMTLSRRRHCAAGDVPPWTQSRTMRHHLLPMLAAPATRPGQRGAPSSLALDVGFICGLTSARFPRLPHLESRAKNDHHVTACVSSPFPPLAEAASPSPSFLRRVEQSSDHKRGAL